MLKFILYYASAHHTDIMNRLEIAPCGIIKSHHMVCQHWVRRFGYQIWFCTRLLRGGFYYRFDGHFKGVISEHMLWMKCMSSCEIALRLLSQNTSGDKSAFVQVIVLVPSDNKLLPEPILTGKDAMNSILKYSQQTPHKSCFCVQST